MPDSPNRPQNREILLWDAEFGASPTVKRFDIGNCRW